MWSELRQWARTLKRGTLAVYLAVRDERAPWLAKAIGMVIVAYALSPIDLIPISYRCSAIRMMCCSFRLGFGW
jgi:uncharacterized membrane protein YkvA (DUF1232 family)